jgi:hypothetical protein
MSTNDLHAVGNVLIGLVILAWVLARQLQRRPVQASSLRVPAILAAIGLYETARFLGDNAPAGRVPAGVLALLVVGVLAGVGLAALRGLQMRVWLESGTAYRQGSVLTVVLWLVAIGLHLALDAAIDHVSPALSGLGTSSLLLYLGCVLGVQGLVVRRRAAALSALSAPSVPAQARR